MIDRRPAAYVHLLLGTSPLFRDKCKQMLRESSCRQQASQHGAAQRADVQPTHQPSPKSGVTWGRRRRAGAVLLLAGAAAARSGLPDREVADPWLAAPAADRHRAFSQFLADHKTGCAVVASVFNGSLQLGQVRGHGWSVTCADGRSFGLLIEPVPTPRAWFVECTLLARQHPTLRCFQRLGL